MAVWRMRISCCILKATNTHIQYVTFTAFPLQQWLQERTSLMVYPYVVCLVTASTVYQGNIQSASLLVICMQTCIHRIGTSHTVPLKQVPMDVAVLLVVVVSCSCCSCSSRRRKKRRRWWRSMLLLQRRRYQLPDKISSLSRPACHFSNQWSVRDPFFLFWREFQ